MTLNSVNLVTPIREVDQFCTHLLTINVYRESSESLGQRGIFSVNGKRSGKTVVLEATQFLLDFPTLIRRAIANLMF